MFHGSYRSLTGRRCKPTFAWLLCVSALCIFAGRASAQDLTPRAYWPTPHGTKLFVIGYAHQQGDVLLDPSLPITGVDSNIDSLVLAYQQSISLFGRSSNFQFEVPLADATTTGMLPNGIDRREVSGLGDVAALLSINLIGAPTMDLDSYQAFRKKPRAILGASVKIVAPTGEYDADRLINVGTNRWAIRARLGYAQPLKDTRWVVELAVGIWFFEDNHEFLGQTRKQDPITALDFSLIRRFGPGFWGSLDFNYFLGGRSTIAEGKGEDFQRNSRYGFTIAYPFKGRHAIKTSFSNGIATRSGDDFQTFAVSYIYRIN